MTNYEKLINTLSEVFMLDKAELDFGIYRIMNQKRKDIEQFLNVDLVPQVKSVLSESLSVDKQGLQKELDEAVKSAQALGADPETLPKVIQLKAKLGEAADLVGIENEVFSLLANFFKRYFDNGDFISMRRYKKDVYSIPYEGEEVKLHWANADQYYIKTSEHFKNYRFKLTTGETIAFELIEASTEQNNNKTQGDKERRFAINAEKTCEKVGEEFKIYFTYEPADKKVKQSDLLSEAFEKVKTEISAKFPEYAALLAKDTKYTGKTPRTILEKHLTDYTSRNTFDYFIHKDLGVFLGRELDFYIKNEVLFIDDLNTRDEQEFLKQLSKIKAIKKIGEKIISFLAQLENFQKKLWLKKKIVVECNYCITLDRVPKELYKEIIENKAQLQEWIKLFAIDAIKKEKATDLFPTDKVGFTNPLTTEFLNQNQFLLLDTAFFPESFKWKLIGSIEKFDEQCDGLLINSENFQALNLLQKRYEEQVKCTYIDPPYNTGGDGFNYKDSFQHSSWLSMMENRVSVNKNLLNFDGVIFTSIDDNERNNLESLYNNIFGLENQLGDISVVNNFKGRSDTKHIATAHEYLLMYQKGEFTTYGVPLPKEYENEYKLNDEKGLYRLQGLRKRGTNSRRIDRPNMYYPIYINLKEEKLSLIKTSEEEIEILPKLSDGIDGCWRWGKETFIERLSEVHYQLVSGRNEYDIFQKDYLSKNGEMKRIKPKSFWHGPEFSSESGTLQLKNIMYSKDFPTPKSTGLLEYCLQQSTNQTNYSITLDYFAGSSTTGHAVINLNREDNGNRKYILVEMGAYFETVTKPRIQKVVYSKDWKDGKPLSKEGISHCFKYMKLEGYEDTLNNLALNRNETQQHALEINPAFKEGYMLNYMLDVETQGSLLNLEWFINPFNCFLNVTRNNELQPTKVDLIETFNYLIGLVVESYAVPKDGYIVVTGKNLAGESILVVWRDCTQHNNEELNKFLEKSKYNPLDTEYDRIYVNGDNNVENLKTGEERWKVILIEEEFKKRMFENI